MHSTHALTEAEPGLTLSDTTEQIWGSVRTQDNCSVRSRGGRYVLIIHFYVESGQKMIQFNIQFKIESKIFIQ